MDPVTITLYSKNDCQGCTATKRRFKKLGIEYTEINIEENAEAHAALKAEGWLGAPVVKVGDIRAWRGFRPDLIAQIKEGL